MDGVNAENNRDAQAAFLQGGLLHLAGVVAQHMQEGARTQLRPAQAFLAAHHGVGHLHHLGGLLFQGHLGQQGFDLLTDGFIGHVFVLLVGMRRRMPGFRIPSYPNDTLYLLQKQLPCKFSLAFVMWSAGERGTRVVCLYQISL